MTKEQLLFLKSLSGKVNNDISQTDVKAVLKLASYHSILPLCYENLSGAQGFDSENYKSLQSKVFSIVFSQTKRTANFKKIYQTLWDNGIKPIVLKGIICRNLYGELCDHRPSGDEDVLIKKEDYFEASEILKDNGYIPEENVNEKTLDGIQEITFKGQNGLNIEIHLNIIGTENKLRRKMNVYFGKCFENAIVMEVDGQKYCTLDYTEHYIYLFYHMFKHFTTAGVGARQILDIFKFGEAHNDKIDWKSVHDAIESINAHKLYGDIVEIGNRYMGFSADNPFGTTFPERLLEDIFSAGAYGNGNPEQMGSKVKVMAAIEAEGKSNKIKMLFPSVEAMREHYTILHNHPYLLPAMWVVRIVRYAFRSKTGQTYDVLKSEKIADEKIQLLRDYKII
ncbi:MAG: nucleotidyltransferase family protein [Clostridia bacterium]|nr:nucleotidyltransferase family protein [Clostridia bacterium]